MPSSLKTKNTIYEECNNIKESLPDYRIDEAILKEIGSNFRTIPTFEGSLYDHVYIKRYSFTRNERLRCCWKKYVRNIESRVFAPFRFPKIGDLHLRKNAVEFVPSENRYQFDNRKKLKPGPGVDERGQMPIPQELLMRRSGDDKRELDKKQLKKKKSALNLLKNKK